MALITLVVGIVVSIYVIRYTISGAVGPSNAQTVASVANAVQIQVLNYVYSFVANALSERENHRTQTQVSEHAASFSSRGVSPVSDVASSQYEDSMITKIFLFQFVNSYASFFYLAFVAEALNDCPDDGSGCMATLAINLAIIFGSRLVSGNVLELLIPYLSYQFKYKREMLRSEGIISRPEREFMLDPVSRPRTVHLLCR